ncbi:hypothetical protein KKH05_02265 [Patescibacteria group bacterium]|nr:hypothetical protein [Patescibacteria group bacterium]
MFEKRIEEHSGALDKAKESLERDRAIRAMSEEGIKEDLRRLDIFDWDRKRLVGLEHILIAEVDETGDKVSLGLEPLGGGGGTEVYLSATGDPYALSNNPLRGRGEEGRGLTITESLESSVDGVLVKEDFVLGRIMGVEEDRRFIVENPEWIEYTEYPGTREGREEPEQYLDPESTEYQTLINHMQLMIASKERLMKSVPLEKEMERLKSKLEELDIEKLQEKLRRCKEEFDGRRGLCEEKHLTRLIGYLEGMLENLREGNFEDLLDVLDSKIKEGGQNLTVGDWFEALPQSIRGLIRKKEELDTIMEVIDGAPGKTEELEVEVARVREELQTLNPRSES